MQSARVWHLLLSMLAVGVVAQLSGTDLPECSLSCWGEASSSRTLPDCSFDSAEKLEALYAPCLYSNCPPKLALSALNITSIICDVPSRDISLGMRIFIVVATLLSALVIAGRLILKLRALAGAVGWDDWCIVIAVIVVLDAAIGQYLAVHYGIGRDQWKVSFENIDRAFMYFYIASPGYKLGNMFTRMSVLFFYLRIFGHDSRFRHTTYCIMVVNACVGVAFTIADLLQCLPVQYMWEGWAEESDGKCISLGDITLSHSVLNILLDVITLALAVWMVKRLQMKLKKKAAVIGMFALGSLITLVTFLRLQALPHLKNVRNRTWGMAPLAYWSAIEIAAGLILACLPALKKLRYVFRPKADITYVSAVPDSSEGSRSNRATSRMGLSKHLGARSDLYGERSASQTNIVADPVEMDDMDHSTKNGASGLSSRHS